MSNIQQSLNAGQTKGQTQARTEEWMEATKNTTHELNSSDSNSAQLSAQPHQQSNSPHQQQQKEAAGFLQQTGEKMVNMAQGAVDTVKDTLGMGDKK
ncbi:late embryogenesis abundant protein 1-like isoform X2 [Momordica charantia]|uniref:Late embryogenesis abundant protein 1-like isoform X2 n=1 Tax=Momordica charantia TaxID=3673 RepID=A0A6J1CAZ0_MOMCH|nr:late embryogenesis abundant protein 1-like isoform X2 [Momordica charantia]